ncbi:MAG: DUF934 domain-containing protein [Cellvibrionaceae bacterium]
MRKLIKNGAVHSDQWLLIEEDGVDIAALTDKKLIIPLTVWLAQKNTLTERKDEIGVWLNGHDDPAQLKDDLKCLPLIAVHFPAFMDGRGFSTARLLRERYLYTGELRAIGNYIRDQLCSLRRCGFDAFSLPSEIEIDGAFSSLNDFSEYYQAATDQPEPLFRRRG